MTTLAPPPTTGRNGGPRHRAEAPPAGAVGTAGAGGGLAARARRMFTGAPEDPRWARPALWAVLVLATALYAWNLSSLTGNTFYNAAVYSGTQSWKAFFFGALDAGSFITVDKPPFALWVMGLSARVFGYGTWQMMLPMVAVGVGSVALLYRMVKRDFGAVAGTIAALALTLTPITVAITRDTNPDPVLVFLMLLGAATLMKAVRTGRIDAPGLVRCRDRLRLQHEDDAGVRRPAGLLPGLPLGGERLARPPYPQPGRRHGRADRVERLVDGGRGPHPRLFPPVHRRLDRQHGLGPGHRLQRLRPDLRGLLRRWAHRATGRASAATRASTGCSTRSWAARSPG